MVVHTYNCSTQEVESTISELKVIRSDLEASVGYLRPSLKQFREHKIKLLK